MVNVALDDVMFETDGVDGVDGAAGGGGGGSYGREIVTLVLGAVAGVLLTAGCDHVTVRVCDSPGEIPFVHVFTVIQALVPL
ncbi:MAG: hypothetical protein GYA36_21525 [Veillonellaceae bacterium]|nr:hypothetical protein [Veillonellaceae bacterium]